MPQQFADLIVHNGRITTLDPSNPECSAIAVRDGKILVTGDEAKILAYRNAATKVIDLKGRRVIPGLNDSHLHLIRGGLNYNLELRWDGVPSVADALRMLKEQALRTPAPQWVRVVGGWTEFQFAERRMPTLAEINAVSPDTPVFILHLYDRAILNAAALRAVGYSKDTPDPPGGEIQRDKQGNPTGILIARPNAMILYSTLAKGPKLPAEYQSNSTRHFMRELNRLGVTSVIDAGGGYQNYPDDYAVIEDLHRRGEMTVRVAYNLFTQKPKQEHDDFSRWVDMTKPGAGSDFYRMNGAGEMLVFSAADFEDFLEPRPDLDPGMEQELYRVVKLLTEHRWPFRLHATYDESIGRFLDVFERVNREVPFNGLRWFFDHAETVTERNLRCQSCRANASDQENAVDGDPRRSGYRCDARGKLQPLGVALLARQWTDCWRAFALPRSQSRRSQCGVTALHSGLRLDVRGRRGEGIAHGGTICRLRRVVGRLFRDSRRRDQRSGFGTDCRGRQGRVWCRAVSGERSASTSRNA
jgi:predicted amidohydrolase YtcJ